MGHTRPDERTMMNPRQILLGAVLLAFTAFSLQVVGEVGYFGLWQAGLSSQASLQILLDLCIACALAGLWLIGDARQRGVSAWPWLIAVLALGSIGLLAYLFMRERGAGAQPAH